MNVTQSDTAKAPGGSTSNEQPQSVTRHDKRLLYSAWKWRGYLLFVADAALIPLAFIVAYYVRFYAHPLVAAFPPVRGAVPTLCPYLKIAFLMSLAWVFLLAKERTYSEDPHFTRSLPRQVQHVLATGFYAMLLLMVISFMVRYFLLSRLVYAIGFTLAVAFLVLVRFGFHMLGRHLDRHSVVLSRVLLLGWHSQSMSLVERLFKNNGCTKIVGRLVWEADKENVTSISPDIPTLGTPSQIADIHAQTPIDQLVVLDSGMDACGSSPEYRDRLMETLNYCEEHHISVYMVPGLMDMAVRRQEVGSLDGVPLIRLRDSSLHPSYGAAKQTMDVILSLCVLGLGLAIWLAVALLIKLTGKRPVFYPQKRVGLHGVPFRMYKFRSMEQDADKKLQDLVDFGSLKEPVFNIRKDPRVTSIGRILRRISLDEIPQFLNVLAGSMSIIGPRSERVELVEKYDPFQTRRLKAKPGITGYQQVMSRGDPSLAKRIEYDLVYLKNQILLLDLYILLKTVLVVVRGDGFK